MTTFVSAESVASAESMAKETSDRRSLSDMTPGKPIHGGKYMRYNVGDILFDLPARYVPPITPIGQGQYGWVCSVRDSVTGELVAVKKVKHAFVRAEVAKNLLREIKLLKFLQHENINGLRDIIRTPTINDFYDLYLVFDLMDFDLRDVINSEQLLTEEHIKSFVYQLLRALKFVHSAGVLHRDVSPGNVLVSKDCELKLSDFGFARGQSDDMSNYVVTRWYRAPELLMTCETYSGAIDVWSVGCIMAELINRRPLFPGGTTHEEVQMITSVLGTPSLEDLHFVNPLNAPSVHNYLQSLGEKRPADFSQVFPTGSPQALDLLRRMLVLDPTRRITVHDALAHPYLADYHDPAEEPVAQQAFSYEQDYDLMTVEEIRQLIWAESGPVNS